MAFHTLPAPVQALQKLKMKNLISSGLIFLSKKSDSDFVVQSLMYHLPFLLIPMFKMYGDELMLKYVVLAGYVQAQRDNCMGPIHAAAYKRKNFLWNDENWETTEKHTKFLCDSIFPLIPTLSLLQFFH